MRRDMFDLLDVGKLASGKSSLEFKPCLTRKQVSTGGEAVQKGGRGRPVAKRDELLLILPMINFRIAGYTSGTPAKHDPVQFSREFAADTTSEYSGARQPTLVDTLALFCDPSCMKNLSVYVALIMALIPALVATDADGSLNAARFRGVAFDVIPVCHLPMGVASYSDQKDMPIALRDAIKQKLGELVPPNSPFDATDVATTGHNRRLIFIWARGYQWVIATEHGGRGYNDPIFGYEVSPNGQQATLIAERTAFPNSVCLTAEELLKQTSSHRHVELK
jgi:hypothetical protein